MGVVAYRSGVTDTGEKYKKQKRGGGVGGQLSASLPCFFSLPIFETVSLLFNFLPPEDLILGRPLNFSRTW